VNSSSESHTSRELEYPYGSLRKARRLTTRKSVKEAFWVEEDIERIYEHVKRGLLERVERGESIESAELVSLLEARRILQASAQVKRLNALSRGSREPDSPQNEP
jgi:hypothetical protein